MKDVFPDQKQRFPDEVPHPRTLAKAVVFVVLGKAFGKGVDLFITGNVIQRHTLEQSPDTGFRELNSAKNDGLLFFLILAGGLGVELLRAEIHQSVIVFKKLR